MISGLRGSGWSLLLLMLTIDEFFECCDSLATSEYSVLGVLVKTFRLLCRLWKNMDLFLWLSGSLAFQIQKGRTISDIILDARLKVQMKGRRLHVVFCLRHCLALFSCIRTMT